jgi:hypothetical protein
MHSIEAIKNSNEWKNPKLRMPREDKIFIVTATAHQLHTYMNKKTVTVLSAFIAQP